MKKVIHLAKTKTGLPLRYITGETCTDCISCRDGKDLIDLDPTDSCAVNLIAAFTAIESAGGLGVPGNLPRDPWGSPYLIDENEMEPNFPNECDFKDVIYSAGPNGITGGGDDRHADPPIDNIVCPN